MKPPYTLLSNLPSFGGGLLAAEIRSTQAHAAIQINAIGPGYIGASDLYAGPKEWSPHGLVPKSWQLLFRLDGTPLVELLVTYFNIEGHGVTTRMTLTVKKGTSLYFIQM